MAGINDGNMADFKSPLDWLYANEAMNEGRREGGGAMGAMNIFISSPQAMGLGPTPARLIGSWADIHLWLVMT